MSSDPRLSVVVPIRDERESLEMLHLELDAALASVEGGVELIFVDDGSADGSREILRDLAHKDPRVRPLFLDGRHGQSAALDAGFRAMRGEIVATLDADLQNDPADIPRLMARLGEADVVNGVRASRHDHAHRIFASRVANAVRNRVTGEAVTDVGCSLRVMRSDFVRRITLYRGSHRFLPTLLRLEGARIAEQQVAHRPRRYGTSKYGIGDRLWVGIVDLLAIRWMQTRRLSYRVVEASPRPEPTDLGANPAATPHSS